MMTRERDPNSPTGFSPWIYEHNKQVVPNDKAPKPKALSKNNIYNMI